MPFDRSAAEALTEARRNLSLDNLIRQLTGSKIDKRSPCPSCGKVGKFGTFTRNGARLFKCFNSSCPLHETGDDVHFVEVWLNLNRKSAFKELLKLAGVG